VRHSKQLWYTARFLCASQTANISVNHINLLVFFVMEEQSSLCAVRTDALELKASQSSSSLPMLLYPATIFPFNSVAFDTVTRSTDWELVPLCCCYLCIGRTSLCRVAFIYVAYIACLSHLLSPTCSCSPLFWQSNQIKQKCITAVCFALISAVN
jgi:hypothetical protein